MKVESEAIETTYQTHSVTIWPITAYVGKRVKTTGFGLAIDGRRLPVFCPDYDAALAYARARIEEWLSFADYHSGSLAAETARENLNDMAFSSRIDTRFQR
jgi:hypothetical protein